MKVKDLNFGIHSNEAGLMQFVEGEQFRKAMKFKLFLIERHSSCSYYLYVHEFSHELPCAYYRVSANSSVEDVLNDFFSKYN